MDLGFEILAAALDACAPVDHTTERGDRVSCAAHASGAADERADALEVEGGGRALGEVLAESFVEPMERSVDRALRTPHVVRITAADHEPRSRGDVVHSALVRGGEIPPQQAGSSSRPEEEADAEADRESDRDVLDADEADAPADRLDDVEEDEEHDREAGLARGERDRTRAVGGGGGR